MPNLKNTSLLKIACSKCLKDVFMRFFKINSNSSDGGDWLCVNCWEQEMNVNKQLTINTPLFREGAD